ncbi:MAG: bacteriohopanetetrol glucosamine biosynthesis glycosyltransferase HpnI [Rhodospirillales bacterium]|nr:bacteriohopanetetrol glucosamine biosynthesis glycosyltransferase HpnI [Rhodospirillales bacterium]
MSLFARLLGLLALLGLAEVLAGLLLVRRFTRRPPPPRSSRPPLSVLKPLAGDEPLLEEALASLCQQDYSEFQIVLGAADPADPALAVARRVAARFPVSDITVLDGAPLSAHHPPPLNRKVANLIAMLPVAKHGVLVIADADVHAPPGYLDALAAVLEEPETGLVTTLYTGRPGVPGWPARLGASQITHGFLPDALIARALGRQDALGATVALSRVVLARSGGFEALADELADDAVLGRRVASLGLAVRLAATVPATTVPERSLGALFRHELRWARTIRALAPAGFSLSALRYPLAWALAALVASGFAPWSAGLFLLAWTCRVVAARGIDRALGLPPVLPAWLIPFRDLFSFSVLLASHAGRRVEWRGLMLRAGRPGGGRRSHAPERGCSCR